MYFELVNHYNDDSYDQTSGFKNQDCFICFEKQCKNGYYPIKLNSTLLYHKNCICDGYIHNYCLDVWYNASSKCPICRNLLQKKTPMTTLIFSNGGYILFMYLSIKNNMNKIMRFFSVFIFIYFTCDYYFSLVSNKKIMNYDFDNIDFNSYNNYLNKSEN